MACKGVWLDYGVLTEILGNSEPNWTPETEKRILKRLSMFNTAPLGEERDLSCPHCDEILDEVNYQGTSNIIVNPCVAGHGLWLDQGELLSIRVFLNHWSNFAKTHEVEIEALLDGIDYRFSQLRNQILRSAPGDSTSINRMIYDVLDQLDRD